MIATFRPMSTIPDNQAIDEPSLGAIVATLWRHKWFIVITTAVFGGVFGGMAFFAKPVFRTTTWLVPAEHERAGSLSALLGSVGNIASMIGIEIDAETTLQTQEALAILRSREFRAAFIRDHDLMPILFASRWDSQRKTWKSGWRDPPTMADALRLLDEIVIIGRNQKTSLYSIQVEWTDPRLAAQWANTLVSRLNSEMRVRAIARSSESIAYLEKELASGGTVGLREATAQVLSAQINERMLATVSNEYAFKVVERAPVPDRKFRPRVSLQLMVGVIAGGILSSVLVIFGPLLRRNLEDARRAGP